MSYMTKDEIIALVKDYKNQGYDILRMPDTITGEFYESCKNDIDLAMTNIAGISVVNMVKYISGIELAKCQEEKNCFATDILTIGRGDDMQYIDFFDDSHLQGKIRTKKIYVHLDMSISGDKTGIAATTIDHIERTETSKEVIYRTIFSIAIQAPKGDKISFAKHRQFIRDLKKRGWRIGCISYDTFQSSDLGEQMAAEKFNTETISVDRVSQDKICEPYLVLKNAIHEQRWIRPKNKLQDEELVGLNRDNNSGKIDHNEGASKDTSDAIAGSLFSVSKHIDEFLHEWGTTNQKRFLQSNETMQPQKGDIDLQSRINKQIDDMIKVPIDKTFRGRRKFVR